MRSTAMRWPLLLLGAVGLGSALAGELFVYPGEGQTAEQMEKDKYDCYEWAKQSSGFDPSNPPQIGAPPPQAGSTPSVGRGMARGAVAGALIGGIADDNWGKGAAVGAAAGGLFSGVRRRDQQAQQQQAQAQWTQQQQSELAALRADYDRAYAACLEGKGYTVK